MKMKKRAVPYPKEAQYNGGYHIFRPFVWAEDRFVPTAGALVHSLTVLHAVQATLTEKNAASIFLETDGQMKGEEYRLTHENGVILCRAATAAGMARAIAALLQLAQPEGTSLAAEEFTIHDFPDSEWRGLMVDAARLWYPLEVLRSCVDLCFLCRMNRLHLHLMDDQGYRLPSARFPALSDPGRCYTREELAYLNQYAAARGITLIPEIEAPGHCRALIDRYPEVFGDEGGRNIVNIGRPAAMEGLAALIDEVCALFPDSPYIHVGGDEANISLWEEIPECLAYREERKLSTVKELYSHFIARLTNLVLERGRTPIIWEGFPAEGSESISRRVLVMEFESSYRLAPDLIRDGFRIINTSWQPLYIVPQRWWSDEKIYRWNIQTFENWNPHSAAFDTPIVCEPDALLLGAQLCVWESGYNAVRGRLCQNLPAVAERTWNVRPTVPFSDYRQSSASLRQYLERLTGLTNTMDHR